MYAFPSPQSVTEQNLRLWLRKLGAGLENPISKFSVFFSTLNSVFCCIDFLMLIIANKDENE